MKKIITFCFVTQFFCAVGFAQKQGQDRVDSILSVVNAWSISNNSHDTLLAASYIELSYELHKIDPDKGIVFGQKALELSTKINWEKGVASSYNRIGLCYWAKSDFPKALEFQFKALKLNEDIDFKHGIAKLKINEELKNISGEARNLGNIGIVYDASGEYEKALQYYSKALSLYRQLNDKVGIARNLGNVAFVYQEMGQYARALEYNSRALEMNAAMGNTIQVGINIGNMGEEYYHIAADAIKNRINLSPDSLKNIKTALLKAEEYLTKSIAIFTEVNDQNFLHELYQYLSDVQLLKGNYSAGLSYYKKSIAYRDSVHNEDNKQKIAQLEKTREEDIKQKEIELLKSQNEIQRLTSQRRMAVTYGLGCAFIGLSFLTFAFLIRTRRKKNKS
ncbi:MAG: tetratricopeptide repeat protein [Bacteroidetes bacterium]|nr:tetratricopeptide repeat protein [Bacteroidota bacterium]